MLHVVKDSETGQVWADSLEKGEIVQFARCPIELPGPEDQEFLRSGLSPYLKKKNVSWYPRADKLTGVQAPARVMDRAHQILRAHAQRVRGFLEQAMPDFTRDWEPGTSSFRPLEEKGRNLGPHASNELVHVDAGAYGATHGDRILRFFVNLNPLRDRVWVSRGAFAELFAKHGAEAGVQSGGLDAALPEQAWSGLLKMAGRAFPMARVIDSSPYDRRMRRFHNWMKDTPAFQQGPTQRFAFPPLSAWMVLTDGVSHACIEGQHALVDTFLVPLRNCRRPAPYHLLAGQA
jgi:3-deoxy-D-manno-octulosonic acid hydroxylase-like protein